MSDIPSTSVFPNLVKSAIVVTGPTAAGKTALALPLAEAIGGEILSLDSIAVYRKMDIGTAKPTSEDRERVPHHLLDLADPNEEFSVANYLAAAHQAVHEVLARGKRPIFVGGTPMFLKAILRGFDPGPPPDWEFRKQVELDIESFGVEALRERLKQVDPLSAVRIAPGDTRRMIRALEVSMKTGVPLSHRQVQFESSQPASACAVFALRWERSVLHERINRRVDQMFKSGLIEEVQALLSEFGALSRTASQAVGYREIIDWLSTSDPVATVVESVSAHTRQMAKRQETWFRSFSEVTPIAVDESSDHGNLVDQLQTHLETAGM